jgi:outer membrane protein
MQARVDMGRSWRGVYGPNGVNEVSKVGEMGEMGEVVRRWHFAAMNNLLRVPARCFAGGVLALLGGSAWADFPVPRMGDVTVRGGFAEWAPSVRSGDFSAPSLPGSRVGMRPNSQVYAGITYYLSERLAVDLPLTAGFDNELEGAGALKGAGTLARVETLPVTALFQYRFAPVFGVFRPYLAAGPSYVRMWAGHTTAALDAVSGAGTGRSTTMRLQSKWAPTFGAGLTYDYSAQVFLELSMMKTLVSTRLTLSTGQSLQADLHPTVFSTSMGWRF